VEVALRVLLVPNTAASMVWFREPFLRELIARGHRVWVAAPDGWGVDRIVATGASFLPVFQHQGWAFGATEKLDSSYANPLKDLTFVRELRRICRVVRPDLVLSYTHKMSVLVPMAARAAGVPRVHGMITGLGFANLSAQGDLRARVKQTALREAFFASIRAGCAASDSITVLNQDNLDALVARRLASPQKLFLLDGEGVDTERFAAPPLPWSRGAMTFLMVARLVWHKGVGDLVAAARIVKQRFPAARFVVAGTVDPQHPDAISAEQLDAWRAEGVVELPGHVDDVRGLLLQSHAFVLPSYETEGLPMSIMEAMAASRPIVTTAVPGNRETVSPGENGYLVPPQDPGALADALIKLLDDPGAGEQMGLASRARCESRFDHRIINAALLGHLGL
jgi:glycosyltransferase involved in cell wall biosynthesis